MPTEDGPGRVVDQVRQSVLSGQPSDSPSIRSIDLFTIGHSTLPIGEFLAHLERHGVRALADVRRFPGSRRHPHFGREALAASLAARRIGYFHLPALGGRRVPRPDSPNTAWRNAGFRGYADYMGLPEFHEALDRLVGDAAATPTVVVCAEALPWRCHRWLMADALVARGVGVWHITADRVTPHRLTPFARVDGDRIVYDGPPPPARQAELFPEPL